MRHASANAFRARNTQWQQAAQLDPIWTVSRPAVVSTIINWPTVGLSSAMMAKSNIGQISAVVGIMSRALALRNDDEPPGSVRSEIAGTTFKLSIMSHPQTFSKPNVASKGQLVSFRTLQST
ncbi:hypothetical protein F5146DRAFT_1005383 [Armillaria mellea]|nr:hypothetical protein F5146DRAFT_1005383 [Armillaria mellea]